MGNLELRNFKKDMQLITNYYKKLTTYTKQNKSVGGINEWVVDNYYLLSEQEQYIYEDLKSKKFIKLKNKKQLNLVVDLFLRQENYKVSASHLFTYLNDYQTNNNVYFTYDEIDYINTALKVELISKLNMLCGKLGSKFNSKNKIEKVFRKISILQNEGRDFDVYDYIKIDDSILSDYFYIMEINHRLKYLGEQAEAIFKDLNLLLNTNGASLKDVVKYEQDENTTENVLMVNLFLSIKTVTRFKLEDFYAQVSFTEKALMAEAVDIYDKMYEVSKLEYRHQIKKNIKKNKVRELDYVKGLLKQASLDNKHVGFYLFEEPNYAKRSIIYVISIMTFATLISLYLSVYMGPLAFLFLIIPIIGLMVDITNQILLKTISTKSLFRLKLENGLPVDYSTMVVIPTILKNPKKVKEMFDNLEIYYLSNRSNNLYFTLLGDTTSEKTKDVKADDDIVHAGKQIADALNSKYGKEIFYFAYRNRFYNEGEGTYLGYERKRGALQHFNLLLLKKLSTEEKKEYFKCQTFDNFKHQIKYVITLDADTRLLLNTALKLIGTMVHPMNQPILSSDNTHIIGGHALMQPRVSIDVEVTNKSEYSQLFAGLGGLDIYATKQFDLYQDLFDEGIFTGKGIYDLEMFDKVLTNVFPENLILSHDLIEGNYLRCGYISDIELFDGFPSRYLNDAMRHHRWTRGDWQIIGWLKKWVRGYRKDKETNPLNLISRWKIFDNLRRSLMVPSLLLLVIYGFTFSNISVAYTIGLVSTIIALPIFFYLLTSILSRQKYDILLKYYMNLIWGFLATINKSLIVLALLPYETALYLNAIGKSLYRMYISKKNLLNWITAEEVDATSKNTLTNYIKSFSANYVAAFILVFLTMQLKSHYLYLAYSLSFVWFLAPFLMYFISRDLVTKTIGVDAASDHDIRELAVKTWKFFSDNLTEECHYLIPDNYQLNRKEKIDYRTSPTNIGFSIVSTISAYEIKIIEEKEALETINNIIKSVDDLPKWHGHLYNWYDIKTKEALQPLFISTADSGNFISSLYVLKGFLDKFEGYSALKYRVKKLIENADFSKLYNKEIDVFSIGYTVNDGALVPYHYNNFLSEARLVSYIAIAKGEVPFKHWFCLDKTLTKHKWYKGVVSWTGTMFEYYMPLIFMKSYEHTLLDETYAFAYYAHKSFVEEANPSLPWGITESAYNELDDAQNYKYKAFGIPYLKFHDSETPQIVIAPYGSIMAMSKYPHEVYENIKKFDKLGMNGKYGLYESYDYDDATIVKSYYSHHQGMILSSIANHLKDNVIQKYFHADKSLQAVEILLKEKVQVRTYIDLKIARYKKYNYERDIFANDIREQDGIMPTPSVGILSNGFYSCFINDRGIGFSKYKNLQINRYRKVTTENYGVFVYLKDLNTNYLWTNTYYPLIVKPNKYRVLFASDRIKYMREDNDIITNTEITITKEHSAEIRKITIRNDSERDVDLELTSYGEVIMARPEEDIAHPAFNSMTIKAEVDSDTKSLIFTRRSRTKDNTTYFVINRFFTEIDGDDFEFEISRDNFIGRNNMTNNPSMKMTSNIDELLDPIMSIRKKISLKPDTKKTIYLIVGFGKSKEQVLEIVNTYKDKKSIDSAFDEATVLNNMRNRYADLNGSELRSYTNMLKYIYQTIPVGDERREVLKKNALSQEGLWKYGISGDLPIILLNINSTEDVGFIKQLLQAYEFYKSRAIYIDIVIINSEKDSKKEIIGKYIGNLMFRINNLNYFENSPGHVYIVKDLTNEEFTLLKTIAKISLDTSLNTSLDDQINALDSHKKLLLANPISNLKVVSKKQDTKFSNDFGGFVNDGREYLISDINTPKPWSNILANENFGTVITNNFGGFTYAYNSREFKITNWSNDSTSDVSGEELFINNERIIPSYVKHGFGYSTFVSEHKDFTLTINVFVPMTDNIKVYSIDIKNKTKTSKKYDLKFAFKPVLGESPELTNRHILSEFDIKNNMLNLRNVYNNIFKHVKVFVTASEKITNYDLDSVSTKSVTTSIEVDDHKKMSFILGSTEGEYIYKDTDVLFDETKAYWINKLNILEVETPDLDFNYMINGWYLYQVYASRLYAKAAFYQVGGATGFRDQLQDSMSLLYSNPIYTKKQILKHANHQFEEGDVLHWWHEELHLGARTRFVDDYLWLIYVTYEYLKVTNDYSILDEQVGFVTGEKLAPHESEKGITFTYLEHRTTLAYHLQLAINKAMKQMGSHNLPLMGSGDWNDGMNQVGEDGKGESVWMGFFLYDLLIKMAEISSDDLKNICLAKAMILKESLNSNAWDGKWYLRAYFDDGTPLGSHNSSECQIDLISQAWSIITDIADTNKIKSIIKEVDHRLVDTKAGIIKLLDPAFTYQNQNPGYISNYIPGIRENGAQYTHAAMWYIMALVKAGSYEKAYQYYQMLNPVNKNIDSYKVEPYVIAADVYSNPNFKGQGGWTWYTGSASWAYKIGIEEIIGLKKRGDTLVIEPHFTWDKATIKYTFGKSIYNITIYKDAEKEIITLLDDAHEHNIVIGGSK